MLYKSQLSPIEVPEIPLHHALFPRMESYKDKAALVNGISAEEYTYREVLTSAKNVAGWLVGMGLRKGDVVAILCPNVPEVAITFLGIWTAGGVAMPINSTYTARLLTGEVLFHLENSGASFLLTQRQLMPVVREACKDYSGLRRIITTEPTPDCVPFSELANHEGGKKYPVDIQFRAKEDLALLVYSSGTTGLPKGVMLTHYNVLFNLTQFTHEETRITGQETRMEIVLGILPFFTTAGIMLEILLSLGGGAKLVCMPKFEPHSFLGAIEKYKVSFLPTVPPILVFLNTSPLVDQYDISSIRGSGVGGAPADPEQMEKARRKLNLPRFTSGYGLTEVVVMVSVHRASHLSKTGSVGILASNIEAKVVDTSTGETLGPGQEGELCVRGPNVMKGYWKNPQATREAIDRYGFLHTGDVANIDEDGYLFIVDRVKEMIKFKGFQVAPAELEGILRSHPGVLDVGVTGVHDTTQRAGELPRAYVLRKPGSKVTEAELSTFVEERVAPFKRLRGGVVFVMGLPRNQGGKLMRRRLREYDSPNRSKI